MGKAQKTDTGPIGAHLSLAKGLHKALYKAEACGCTALQIFTKSSGTWKERILLPEETVAFAQAREKTGIHEIASHTSYLINLASIEKKKHRLSCDALRNELVRSSMLKIPYVILHPGSHMSAGEEKGIRQIAESINRIFKQTPKIKTKLLLETPAGQGTCVGHTFEQLASILELIDNQKLIGVCLDTCHIFAAGYDIRTERSYEKTLADFDSKIGFRHLYMIHLNDSKKELGTRVDRHEHIGKGHIGLKAFELIMTDKKLQGIPKIIETPKGKNGEDMDRVNLGLLKKLQTQAPEEKKLSMVRVEQ